MIPPVQGKPRAAARSLAIAGALLTVGSMVVYAAENRWAFETQVGAGLGGMLLLGAVLLQPDTVKAAFTGRSVRYGSNAVVVSLAFIGILLLINFLSLKYNYELDLTETGLYTLSEQTITMLNTITEPVLVMGFFQSGDPRLTRAREYLERYSRHTHYLAYEFHDPNIEPALAQKYELSSYGMVFISGDNRHDTGSVDEQSITSALIRVTNDSPRTVYFLTGHGERDLNDTAPEGLYSVKQALERENFIVNTLNLSAGAAAVPADASLLVLAGPTHALFEAETGLIADWMAAGGRLLLLVDPLAPPPVPALLQEYGLALPDGFVVEDSDHALVTLGPEGLTPQILAPMIVKYPFHEITRGLNGYQSFFPFARAVAVTPTGDAGKIVTPILTTSPASWAETDPTATEPVFTQGQDFRGPLNLAAAAENSGTSARLVLLGNTNFIANQNLSPQVANLDLFMNAVNWLTEEEALISIRPKQAQNRRLFLTSAQVNFTLFTTVILVPLVIFSAGVVNWWKRR